MVAGATFRAFRKTCEVSAWGRGSSVCLVGQRGYPARNPSTPTPLSWQRRRTHEIHASSIRAVSPPSRLEQRHSDAAGIAPFSGTRLHHKPPPENPWPEKPTRPCPNPNVDRLPKRSAVEASH